MSTINQRIKQLVEHYGVSISTFASMCGVGQRTLSNMFIRGTEPSIKTISAIVEYTNVRLDWLIKGVGPMFASLDNIETQKSSDDGRELHAMAMKILNSATAMMQQAMEDRKEMLSICNELRSVQQEHIKQSRAIINNTLEDMSRMESEFDDVKKDVDTLVDVIKELMREHTQETMRHATENTNTIIGKCKTFNADEVKHEIKTFLLYNFGNKVQS